MFSPQPNSTSCLGRPGPQSPTKKGKKAWLEETNNRYRGVVDRVEQAARAKRQEQPSYYRTFCPKKTKCSKRLSKEYIRSTRGVFGQFLAQLAEEDEEAAEKEAELGDVSEDRTEPRGPQPSMLARGGRPKPARERAELPRGEASRRAEEEAKAARSAEKKSDNDAAKGPAWRALGKGESSTHSLSRDSVGGPGQRTGSSQH